MESKNESIQLTRICITTTFPVGEKSIFFEKPLQGRFPTRLFLYCTQMSIAKLQKKPVYCHSHPGLAVRHMCGPKWSPCPPCSDRIKSVRPLVGSSVNRWVTPVLERVKNCAHVRMLLLHGVCMTVYN